MKYSWRREKKAYFEDRRFESTVIFNDRLKPNFVRLEMILTAFYHLERRSPMFGERRFGAF